MTYRTEFPHYESEIPDVFLTAPWSDHSWHNDACPSFARTFDGGREIHVFVDEIDPAKRWEAEGGPRFSVHTTDNDGDFEDTSFSSDSLSAVLDCIGFIAGEVAR